MPQLIDAGLTPAELEQLVDGARWEQWCAAEPALRAVAGLPELRQLRGEEEDQLLGALLRLASKSGGDDQLAGIAVMHQLRGALRLLARRFWHLGGTDVEETVVGAMWEQIRSFDGAKHEHHFGAVLVHAARRTLRRTLLPDGVVGGPGAAVPFDPHSWLIQTITGDRGTPPDELDAREELQRVLTWAVGEGHIARDDAGLLMTLVAADRATPERVNWLRGACSVAAVTEVAEQRGVCAKSVTRARDRVLGKLRAAVPAYLEEVA